MDVIYILVNLFQITITKIEQVCLERAVEKVSEINLKQKIML